VADFTFILCYQCHIRSGLEFHDLPYHAQYISNSTDNHPLVFGYGGFKDIRSYRYWNPASKSVDFDGLLEDIGKAPENSVIVLQLAAHNPTGCDLTQEQWTEIANVMEVRLFVYRSVPCQTHTAHQKQNRELTCLG
jgi:aspartate aminotransferase